LFLALTSYPEMKLPWSRCAMAAVLSLSAHWITSHIGQRLYNLPP